MSVLLEDDRDGRRDTLVVDRGEADLPPPPPPSTRRDRARRGGGAGRTALVAAVTAAVTAAGVAVPLTVLDDRPAATASDGAAAPVRIESDDSLVAAVAKAVAPSVVRIDVQGQQGAGAGSGVVYRADGYILTNAHVVDGAQRIRVSLPDGERLAGELVGADTASDLAVVRVDADDLPAARLAGTSPQVGDVAVAIGSPFGLDGSVTSGVVSALNRTVSGAGAPLIDMLQTDAAINPGNSGGALANAAGEVMGVNTAIFSRGGGNDGIGFAIPISTAQSVADQLIETGAVRHAFLGVSGQDVDPAVAELYRLPVERGVVLVDVQEGTPADRAGLEQGDIVTAVDGEGVGTMAELAAAIARHEPGDRVELTVVREGDERRVEVTLGERPTAP